MHALKSTCKDKILVKLQNTLPPMALHVIEYEKNKPFLASSENRTFLLPLENQTLLLSGNSI